jgi:serine protease Do
MKKHLITVALALSSGLAGAYVFQLFNPHTENYFQNSITPSFQTAAFQSMNAPLLNEDFINASNLSNKSVVFITTLANTSSNNWLDWFYNGGTQQTASSGSGVIFSNDGYIVTNNHVIEQAEKIEVVYNRKNYVAKLIGTDPSTDIAVLKIEEKNLPAVVVGNSNLSQVGEWVLAVGNPFNLTSTVTAGIISAKGRNINLLNNNQFPIESFIQTDAAINPGNSGGALINLKGELIGVNTAIYSRTGSYTGYGFAVPSNIVKKVVGDIIKNGIVQKAFLGIDVTEINGSLMEKYKLNSLNGVIITAIQEGESAADAGLKNEDIILKINQYDITSKSMYDEVLSYYSPGNKITITYLRAGKSIQTEAVLTNKFGTTDHVKNTVYKSEKLGAEFEVLSKVEKEKLNITHGVRIASVQNGLIRRLGLPKGFIVSNINNQAMNTPQDIENILTQISGRVLIEGFHENGAKSIYSYYF